MTTLHASEEGMSDIIPESRKHGEPVTSFTLTEDIEYGLYIGPVTSPGIVCEYNGKTVVGVGSLVTLYSAIHMGVGDIVLFSSHLVDWLEPALLEKVRNFVVSERRRKLILMPFSLARMLRLDDVDGVKYYLPHSMWNALINCTYGFADTIRKRNIMLLTTSLGGKSHIGLLRILEKHGIFNTELLYMTYKPITSDVETRTCRWLRKTLIDYLARILRVEPDEIIILQHLNAIPITIKEIGRLTLRIPRDIDMDFIKYLASIYPNSITIEHEKIIFRTLF